MCVVPDSVSTGEVSEAGPPLLPSLLPRAGFGLDGEPSPPLFELREVLAGLK